MNKKSFVSDKNHLQNLTFGIVLLFLGVWVLIIGKTIILPFMIAIFLTFILDPVVSLLQRLKIPLGISVMLTLILAFIILYLFGLLVYANVQSFVGQFPVYQDKLLTTLSAFSQKVEIWLGEPLNIQMVKDINWIETLQRYSVAQGLLSSLGTFVTFIFKMLIVIIFIAYMLTGRRGINQKIKTAFQPEQSQRILLILDNVVGQVQKYLGAKTISSFITGVISIIIFYFFGLDFAIFWGFIIFIFNYIPNIGSIVASLLPVLFSLLQIGSLSTAIWLTFSMGILQFTVGNILEPRIMGRTLNLSPMIVILSLIFWGYIWGVAGMILAVPILATITIVFENFESLRFLSVFFRGKKG